MRRRERLDSISRRRLIQAWIGLLTLTGTRCARKNERRQRDRSTLTVLYPLDERSLQPGSDDVPKVLVVLPLVAHENEEDWYCERPQSGLAERWEHSVDFREWTVHLRHGVKWHDGEPVTAHDIKFTLDLWARPDILHWAAADIDSVTVLDDHAFRASYKRPSKQLLNGWDVFYPRHRLKDLDPKRFWDWEFWTRPVGNGPYRYLRHIPGAMMEFEANPDYYRGKPKIQRLIVKFGAGTSLTELLSASVDAADGISSLDAARLATDSRFQVRYNPIAGAVRIYWNQRSLLFRDAAVRRALTMAINRRELHEVLNFPGDLPITDGFYTSCQFARRQLDEPWPHDPEAARRLLAEMGWRDRGGDVVRERGGRDFVFEAIVPSNWLQAPEAGVFVQDQLRRVGVRMEVQPLDFRVVGERVRAGKFEAALWITSPQPEFHAEFFGAASPIGYENPTVAKLLDTGKAAMDPDERDRIYRDLAKILRAEVPATFLYPKVDIYAASRRVGGFGRDLFMYADRLWVKDAD